jgi:multidrug efflux pump subunit AcrB
MLRYLLQRPIAVRMTLLVLIILSFLAYRQLPISLLPSIDIPEITIATHYINGSPEEIEQTILKPIRDNLLTLDGLNTIFISGIRLKEYRD